MNNISVCEKFVEWAQQALDEWDGVSTSDLVLAICEKTGENAEEIALAVLQKWHAHDFDPRGS